MRGVCWSVLGCVACSFHPLPSGGGVVDGMSTDAPPDTPAGSICFGTSASSLFTQCYQPGMLPTNTYKISSDQQLDTGNCTTRVTSHGVRACVVAAATVTIDRTLTVTGNDPLVLLATGDLTVTVMGTVDASSNNNNDGANTNASTCNPNGRGGTTNTGAGGGAGGSFGTAGGSGGPGNTNGANMGIAIASITPITLRGGCRGASGGDGNGGNGGSGGNSGGAVYLMAGGTITIAGKVYASGARGQGGDATCGGGGGGTGGLIGLDAPMIRIDSGVSAQPEVIANGGSGAGGGGSGMGHDGNDGTLVSTPGALGGAGGGGGGGGGGVGTNLGNVTGGTGLAGSTAAAGGGGGGGYGVLWFVGTYASGNGDISPPPLLHP